MGFAAIGTSSDDDDDVRCVCVLGFDSATAADIDLLFFSVSIDLFVASDAVAVVAAAAASTSASALIAIGVVGGLRGEFGLQCVHEELSQSVCMDCTADAAEAVTSDGLAAASDTADAHGWFEEFDGLLIKFELLAILLLLLLLICDVVGKSTTGLEGESGRGGVSMFSSTDASSGGNVANG